MKTKLLNWPLRQTLIALIPFFCIPAFANVSAFSIVKESKNFEIFFGAHQSQIKSASSTLNGIGLTFGGHLNLTKKVRGSLLFFQAYSQTESLGRAMYTGIGANISYSLLGQFGENTESIEMDGRSIVSINNKRRWNLNVGMGFDQYWLNATEVVFPVSGPSWVIGTEFEVFGAWLGPQLRMAELTKGNGEKVTVTNPQLLFIFEF